MRVPFGTGSFTGVAALLLCGLLAAGCTAKARAIQLGAAEFEASSLEVVDAVDTLRQREVAYAPFTADERRALFIAGALETPDEPGERYTFEDYLVFARPEIEIGADADGAWKVYLAQLRRDYTTFAAIFANLDRGSLLAGGTVADAVPVLDQLLGQLAALGRHVEAHPPRFLSARTAAVERIEAIAADGALNEEGKEKLLAVEMERVVAIAESERALARDIQERVAKALTVGMALRGQLLAYGTVSMADVTEALSTAIGLAGTLTGADLASLQETVDGHVATIEADPDLAAVFTLALEEIDAARVEIMTPDDSVGAEGEEG